MPESAIVDWLKLPGVAIGSDGMPLIPWDGLQWDTPYEEFPNAHPRSAGCYAKAYRVARENNIPIEKTRSCFDKSEKPCEKCLACINRINAFNDYGKSLRM